MRLGLVQIEVFQTLRKKRYLNVIIKHKQTKKRWIVESFLSVLGWLYLLIFFYLLLSNIRAPFNWKLHHIGMHNTKTIVIFTLFIILISTLCLYLWGFYNKKKFSSLRRRRFPLETTDKELAEFFAITTESISVIKEKKWNDR
jgi:biofilm PGA synthesis protein PgaD